MKLRTENEFETAVRNHEDWAFNVGTEAYASIAPFISHEVKFFLDIGSNVGGFAASVLKNHPNANGWLFEPSPSVATAARKRFVGNESILINETALGERNGKATLYQSYNNIAGAGLSDETRGGIPIQDFCDSWIGGWEESQVIPTEVDVRPLDDIFDGQVDLVKIDVEGSEFAVLRGMMKTLARSKPLMLLEISGGRLKHPRWADEKSALEAVLALGYTINGDPLINMDHSAFDKQLDVILVPNRYELPFKKKSD